MADLTDETTGAEVPDAVHRAANAGDVDRARGLLDQWEAGRQETVEILSALRFWRKHLAQAAEAIQAAERIVALRAPGSRQRAADLCRLGELRARDGRAEEAWEALEEAAAYAERDGGLTRSVVGLALELSESRPADPTLPRRAFELAATLLERGAPSSVVILEKARDRAEALGEAARHAALAAAARDLRRALHGRERRRPPSGGE